MLTFFLLIRCVWKTDCLPLLVLTRRGAAPAKTSTSNSFPRKCITNTGANFLENTRELSEIIAMNTGAKFW